MLFLKSSEDEPWSGQSTSLDNCEGVPANLQLPPVDIWSMLLTFKITLLARAELSVEVPDTLSWSSWQQAARLRHKITKMVKTKTQITPANIAIRVICKGNGPVIKKCTRMLSKCAFYDNEMSLLSISHLYAKFGWKTTYVVVQVGCEFPTRHDYFQWHKCRVQSLRLSQA